MYVDETLPDGAKRRNKHELTHSANRSMVRYASIAGGRVPFIFVRDDSSQCPLHRRSVSLFPCRSGHPFDHIARLRNWSSCELRQVAHEVPGMACRNTSAKTTTPGFADGLKESWCQIAQNHTQPSKWMIRHGYACGSRDRWVVVLAVLAAGVLDRCRPQGGRHGEFGAVDDEPDLTSSRRDDFRETSVDPDP